MSAMAARTGTGSWTDTTVAALRSRGFRSGGARLAVIELLGRQPCCLTAQEIFDELRAEGRRVGIASVYRVLEQLEALKLLWSLDVGDGTTRYELAHPSGEHHHHLVCDTCGAVTPFEDAELERTIARVSERMPFTVDEHDIVLHGQCSSCS